MIESAWPPVGFAERRRRRGRGARWIAAVAALVAVTGCQRDVYLLSVVGEAGTGGGQGAGGAGASGGTCSGLGDPIVLPTATGAACAAALETRGHRFALCACDALSVDARLRTDSFDSRSSGVNDETSAAVGVDGALQTTAELQVGGALYVADAGGVRASDHLQVGGSFQSNGPLAMLSSSATLLADAYVDGDVSGAVQVDGTLYVPTTATVGSQVQAAAVTTASVSVPAPCDCSAGFVDVAGAIAAAAADNQDAANGFRPDLLNNVSTSTRLDLTCGTFYLSAMEATAPITLAVHGRALLAVDGDVKLGGGGLTVTFDPSAELDLLVAGWFTTSGGGTIGAPTAPARLRIWIAGTQSLVFDDQPTIAAVIHAPSASVTAPSGLTLAGSLLVKSLALGQASWLHYDRAILTAGVACGQPAASPIP